MAANPVALSSVADAGRVSLAPGVDRKSAVTQVESLIRRDGVAVLDDLVDPALIARVLAEITRDYPDYAVTDPTRNFGYFAGRHTTPLRIAGALGDPALFLPPAIMGIGKHLLGKAWLLDTLGLLVSLPGAEDQDRHPDALLFPDSAIDRLLPPFALALAIPLVAMDEVTGTTAFWRGSHRQGDANGEHDFTPMVQPGSALLWDFRVHHRGLANRSGDPRPVLFAILCREWWHEFVPRTMHRYAKLTLSPEVHAGLSPAMQHVATRATISET